MQAIAQSLKEAVILLASGPEGAWEPMLATIEAAGGGILLSFEPQGVIARLDADAIRLIRRQPGVFLVESDAIAGDEAEAFPAELQLVAAQWNEYLARRARLEEGLRRSL